MKINSGLSRPTQIVAMLAGLSMTALPVAASIFDDFNSPPINPAWEFFDAAGNGSGSLNAGNYDIGGSGVVSSRNDQLFADGVFRVDLSRWTTGVPGGGSQGILFRYSTTGDGYALILDEDGTPNLSFIKIGGFVLGGQSTPSPGLTLNAAGAGYTLEATVIGTSFTGKLFDKSNSQLLATVNWTDTAYSSGRGGLIVANDGTPSGFPLPGASFDNFSVAPVPKTLRCGYRA